MSDNGAVHKINLLGLDQAGMTAFFERIGEKPFRARQVMQWVHQRGVSDFEAMTDLGKGLRARLQALTEIRAPAVVMDHLSADGTRKWLLQVSGGSCIEAVFIPERQRGTLCISSQVGCALDCSFCATAAQGFNRNLTAEEIIGQVWLAKQALARDYGRQRAITNVVFMGMGEPLLNLQNVIPAIKVLLDDYAYGLSKRRVTVSTSGVVPALDKLRRRTDVALAVSLHAPDDALRNELVPLNRKYPIAELLAACRRYAASRERHMSITFEYVMLDGVNDSVRHAGALAALLHDLPAKVNLIPFNSFPGTRYRRSPASTVYRFQSELHNRGVRTTTRRTRGEDIDAACGQLAGRVQARAPRRRARGAPV